MGVNVQHIKDFVPGNALQIHRKVVNPGRPAPIISATLHILGSSGQELLTREVKGYEPQAISVPDEGLIFNSGDKEPFVVDFKINLFANETHLLSGSPHYNIRINTASRLYNVETGLFITGSYTPVQPRDSMEIISSWNADPWNIEEWNGPSLVGSPSPPLPPSPPSLLPPPPSLLPPPPALLPPSVLPLPIPGDPGYPPPCIESPPIPACVDHAYSTYSDAVVTVGGRAALIIDGFLDAILGDYRQLKVWDEHARRMANDPTQFRLTYEYINHFTIPEIYDGQNNQVDFSEVLFDFRNGSFSVLTDDGTQDYFCTYTFNFFPEPILRMYMQQTVLNINFVGVGAGGGYLTNYTSLEETPASWDGLIALGAAALAWKRLATNGVLWRNWLIFEGDVGEGVTAPGGQAAQAAANDAATWYQGMFDSYAAATKFDRFVIPPTEAWEIFATTGFGSYGMIGTQNQVWSSKFRGLTVNKSYQY